MKKLIFFLFFFSLIAITSFSQKKIKYYRIYDFDLVGGHRDSCRVALDKKYGFKLIGAGCIQMKRFVKRNRKRLILLDRQNGLG